MNIGEIQSAQQEREHYFKLTQSATADNENLRQEIERLKTALHTHESYDKTVSEMYEREQKLIEGLQEYANGLVDRKLAKKILKELGVTE